MNRTASARPHQICTQTVMDTSDPTITFDAAGVCNHVHDFNTNVMPRWQNGADPDKLLAQNIAAIRERAKGKEFDCIIGLSGGADSSYMLHKMVTEHGLRPLVFHVDAGWNSELAVHNIHCMIEKLGLDLYTEVINWEEVKNFQLSMFKSGIPTIDMPQDIAFIGVLFKFASQFGIKTILNGGNISTECVSYPQRYFYFPDLTLMRDILKRFGTRKMETYPFTSSFYRKIYMPYFRGVKMFKPLNFMPYVKADAMQELRESYGWKPYAQKHFESRFTRFYEGFWLPTRFQYDVRRVQFSSMILTGQMTREEALEALEKPAYDPDVIRQDFEYIATKLGIDSKELQQYLEMPNKDYWDYNNRAQFFELGEKLLSTIANTKRGGAY